MEGRRFESGMFMVFIANKLFYLFIVRLNMVAAPLRCWTALLNVTKLIIQYTVMNVLNI